MFVLSVLVATVAASYPPTNTGGSNYPAPPQLPPVYPYPYPYPPPYHGGWDHDHDYDNHHRNPCGNIAFYLPSHPGVLNEAFYTPTVRYIRSGRGRIQALLACDANGQTVNGLFAKYNSSSELKQSYLLSFGTTAGATLTCQRNRTYTGSALVNSPPGYSKNVSVFEVACLRLDKTFLGFGANSAIENLESDLAAEYNTAGSRKKREAGESATEASTVAATEAPTAAPTQAATEAATQAATEAATEAATQAATEAATQAATEAATQAATEAATQAATEAATQAATTAAPASNSSSPLGGLGDVFGGL